MADQKLNDFWTTDFVQKHLGEALDVALPMIHDELLCTAENFMRRCESPLEAAFAAWWAVLSYSHHMDDICPWAQVEVIANSQQYRLDFVLMATSSGMFEPLHKHPLHPKIAVELDGHDFHERTKEQVAWRNRRDRALAADGWLVWHFSGSEFHRNPRDVVFRQIYFEAREPFANAMRAAGFWRAKEMLA